MNINIIVAASDTPEELKRKADFVCNAADARPVLQEAIDKADSLDVSCVLLRGNYVINSRSERSPNGAVCFYNPEVKSEVWWASGGARYQTLEGVKPPLGYTDGAVITVGNELFDSISDTERFSLFFSDGNELYCRGLNIKNLTVRLPSNSKPIVVFDGSSACSVMYEHLWITAFDHGKANLATAEGIPIPHPDSVGFRFGIGSNLFCHTAKHCLVTGLGVGFDIGGEHVYCETLAAAYCNYGYRFDCYKGKTNFNDPDDLPARGGGFYPIYCVNIIDEHNVNMPIFGNASHNGNTREIWAQSVTIRGMNLQWPNSCPGYTDRRAEDFTVGRHRATEVQPGIWRGSIEYCMDHTTPGSGVNLTDEPFFEEGHGTNIAVRSLHQKLTKE